MTYSSWRENYIVLHQVLFDIDESKSIDVVAFTLAHELGAIRLNQTAVWNEMLLTYVSAIKWFRFPLERARTYSRDRYGAALSPTGFRGLLINAVGRRLMNEVDIPDYLAQAFRYRGFWAGINTFFAPKPQVFNRINQLKAAGYTYKPPNLSDERKNPPEAGLSLIAVLRLRRFAPTLRMTRFYLRRGRER